jgi:MoxR-like ATPase
MLVEQTSESPLDNLTSVARPDQVQRAVEAARDVFVEETVNRYVVALLRHTRANTRLALGASPRAGIALLRIAKARALAERRDFVLPQDVQAVAEPVLAHRLILAPEARSSGITAAEVVREAVTGTPTPV